VIEHEAIGVCEAFRVAHDQHELALCPIVTQGNRDEFHAFSKDIEYTAWHNTEPDARLDHAKNRIEARHVDAPTNGLSGCFGGCLERQTD
jgi:hypothetical protein